MHGRLRDRSREESDERIEKRKEKKKGKREKKKNQPRSMESDAATLHVANAVRGFRGGKRNAEIDEKFGESRSFLFRSREIEHGCSRGASRAP